MNQDLEHQLFMTGITGELASVGFLPQGMVTQAQIEEVRGAALDEFIVACGDLLKPEMTTVERILMFREWLKTWKGLPKITRVIQVTVSIAVPIGKATVTFSANAIAESDELTDDQVAKAHRDLFSTVQTSINKFIADTKQIVGNETVPQNGSSAQPPMQTTGMETSYPITGIKKVQSKNGSLYGLLIGPQHPRGVFVKNQVLSEAGLKQWFDGLPLESVTPLTGTAYASLKPGGAPNEVTRIQR